MCQGGLHYEGGKRYLYGGKKTKQITKIPLNQTITKPRVFSLRFVIPAQCMEMASQLWVISPCACSFRTDAALGFQIKM